MTPLKIVFRLGSGLASPPYPIHLDALLAHVEVRTAMAAGLIGEGDASVFREIGDALPLARHEADGEWVWKASALIATDASAQYQDSAFFVQRTNLLDYAMAFKNGKMATRSFDPLDQSNPKRANLERFGMKIETARGATKNMLGFFPITAVKELVAWCVATDPDAVRDALHSGYVSHLGGRRRAGFGRVDSIEISEDPAALENWKVRVRPWKMLDDDLPIQAAWRNPYWAADNRGIGFCPARIG